MNNENINVLVIEDDAVDYASIERALRTESEGSFRLRRAGTMKDGKRLLEFEKFDAVVLDLGLPDMSGTDTVWNIHSSAPKIPIVVLTGLEGQGTDQAVLGAGAQDYLAKSALTGKRLAEKIHFAVESIHRRLRSEPGAPSTPSPVKKVLIAYDSPNVRRYLSRIVGELFERAKIDEVDNIVDARKKIDESIPDLVIVDLDLSVKGGKKLLLEAFSHGHLLHTPVLGICANVSLDLLLEFSSWPNVIILRKPATPNEIQHALSEAHAILPGAKAA